MLGINILKIIELIDSKPSYIRVVIVRGHVANDDKCVI